MFAWNVYWKNTVPQTPRNKSSLARVSREKPFWGLEIWRVKWSLSRDDAAAREGLEPSERFFLPSLFPVKSCSYRDSFFKYIWGLCYLGSLLVYQLSFLIYTHLQRGGGQTLAAKIADMADFSWNIYSFEFHNCAQYLLRIYCIFLDVWIIQEDRVTEQHIPINPVIKVLMIDIDFETRVNFIRSYLPNIDIATIAMTSSRKMQDLNSRWALFQGLIKIEYDLVMVEVRNPQMSNDQHNGTKTFVQRTCLVELCFRQLLADWIGQLHTEEDNDGKSKQKIDAGQQ